MIIQADATHIPLADESVQAVVTSPPYWGQRDYEIDGQIGLEKCYVQYVDRIIEVFTELRRVLKPDGTAWCVIGDCYQSGQRGGYDRMRSGVSKNLGHAEQRNDFLHAPNRLPQPGLKNKDLCLIPFRVALALQASGWWVRQVVIWHKPNPMTESVKDRPTASHEYVFFLSKSERYYYDYKAIAEPTVCARMRGSGGSRLLHNLKIARMNGAPHDNPFGNFRNKRSVWTVPTQSLLEDHFAPYPEDLIKPMILASSPPGAIVLDPFVGSGTTVKVAQDFGRIGIGLDLKPEYLSIGKRRSAQLGIALN